MKKYDLIAIGTGSAMSIVQGYLNMRPEARIAVIDKDPPGGICLTKGCVPTKMLVYPAELIRQVEEARDLGVTFKVDRIDFGKVMKRMHKTVGSEISQIRTGLKRAKQVDYVQATAHFTAPYQLMVDGRYITSDLILLCLGSKPLIPPIENLERIDYHTSDSILDIKKRPDSLVILGGGYIAAEYGHFFAAMGTRVTIVGRNKRFLPAEEPEIGALARKKMSPYMTILTDHEAVRIDKTQAGQKMITIVDRNRGKSIKISAEQVMLATGRASNADLLQPEKGGIAVDDNGWIVTRDNLETSQSNIWAFGDANGKHLFKHVANYEAQIVYYNALLNENIRVDYHAVPHAVFCHPEIAAVGLGQDQALETYGEERVLIGFHRYQDTTKGDAMGISDYFVKVIVEKQSNRILGAHIIGPQASVLIQEIVNLMYTRDQTIHPIISGMHIHPSLSEVVDRAFLALMPPGEYQKITAHLTS